MKRLRGCAIVVLVLVVPFSWWVPAASAHNDGRVELYVASFELTSAGGSYRATVGLVDKDSGNAAGGFKVAVTGVDDGGHELPAVTLEGSDGGLYSGSFALVAGIWNFSIAADQGNSTVAADATQRTFTVEVRSDGSVVVKGGGGSSSWPLIVGIGAGVIAVAVGLVLVRRARRVAKV